MNNLEKQLNNEILHEKDSKSALSVIKVQFDKFIHSDVLKPIDPYSSSTSYDRENGLNERKLQIHECMVQKVKASDASLGDNDCSRIVLDKENDQEPMVEEPCTAEYNVFVVDTQHYAQSECIINTCVVEKVDSNVIPDSPDMWESNSVRDSYLVAIQNKHTEFERYKAFNDHTVDYEKLKRKLNETLRLLAQKEIDIKEGLKLKAYEILVVKEKHDELVKQSLLTKSHYEGLVKEKTKVITDLKLKEEKDIDKMISMENQLKFLNEIVYKRNQSIQTIHMLAPKGPTFNGRPTFANPMYLKKAQSEKPCLYEIPYDQSDPANRLVPDREETLTLEKESRSKLNKDLVRPYDYTKLNISHCSMNLKKEMHVDLKYVESLENEIDELESDKAEFSNMYDMLLQECVSNDVMCSYLHSLSDLDAHAEL
ncbi:hypothetical protein Tco_1120206 [Tanacetum coccineum]